MKNSTFSFTDQDRFDIFVNKGKPKMEPKAVIPILHRLAKPDRRHTGVAHF